MASKEKKENLIKFINHQISVDLTPYIDEKNSTRRYINLDWNDMSHSEQVALKTFELRGGKSRYHLEDNGGLGMAMFVK